MHNKKTQFSMRRPFSEDTEGRTVVDVTIVGRSIVIMHTMKKHLIACRSYPERVQAISFLKPNTTSWWHSIICKSLFGESHVSK